MARTGLGTEGLWSSLVISTLVRRRCGSERRLMLAKANVWTSYGVASPHSAYARANYGSFVLKGQGMTQR